MAEPQTHPQEPAPDATVALKGGLKIEAPRATVKVEGAKTPTLKLPGDEPAPRKLNWLPWVLGIALVAVSVGGVFWFLGRPSQPVPVQEPKGKPAPPEKLPPEVEAKVREANQGDVHAMHALAIWYYYGINVPKDRDKGLEWYRKAAAAGSDAASQELAEIQGGRK